MIAPPLRAFSIFPNCESLIHFSNDWSAVSPRVRVTSAAFHRPGSFLMTYLPSGPFSLSSMTSCSIFRPVTSVIDLMVMPSNSRPNEWPTELSRSGRAMMPYLSGTVSPGRRRLLADQAGAAGELGEPEDDELGGLDRGDPDLADHLARIDALGRVGFPVALDVERLVRGQPEQRPAPPLVDQE